MPVIVTTLMELLLLYPYETKCRSNCLYSGGSRVESQTGSRLVFVTFLGASTNCWASTATRHPPPQIHLFITRHHPSTGLTQCKRRKGAKILSTKSPRVPISYGGTQVVLVTQYSPGLITLENLFTPAMNRK